VVNIRLVRFSEPQFLDSTQMCKIVSCNRSGFTLVELLVVLGVIGALMGMAMGVQRYASTKSARSRAEAEIAGLSAAAEGFKADQATYPRSGDTDTLVSIDNGDHNSFMTANKALYVLLSGDGDLNGKVDASEGISNAMPSYFAFKSALLRMESNQVAYIRDPWDSGAEARPYGYSTKRAAALQSGVDDPMAGYNITFDLWSTGHLPSNRGAWIKNW
jgi:prepilin-type N-terminal cleavage/methylation domain-containing protein